MANKVVYLMKLRRTKIGLTAIFRPQVSGIGLRIYSCIPTGLLRRFQETRRPKIMLKVWRLGVWKCQKSTSRLTTRPKRPLGVRTTNSTSRPAIAGNPRCSVFKLGPKYYCEKRASNIALSYGVDVDKMIIWVFYVTMFVLYAKLCSIQALILEVFGDSNLVPLSGFFGLRNLGWFLKLSW